MMRSGNGWRLAVAALTIGLSWGVFSPASAQDPVILDVRTNNPNYKLYVDEPGAIIFSVDPNGNQVQGLVYALTMNFSGNNWIGPLSDQPPQSNVIYSPTAQSTFASIAWNPFYGSGTSPDTILVSFTSFGGPWTFFDEIFRLNVTPSITGGLTFNACPGSGCGAPTGVVEVLDPAGSSLPFEWRGEDREIISLVKPVGDTAYVDTTLVYLGQYDPGDTIWVGFGVTNTIPLGGVSYRIVLEDTSRITPAYVPISGYTSGAVPIRPVNRGTSFDKPNTIVSGRIRHPDTTDIITGILVDFEGIAQIDVGSGTIFEIPFLAKAGIQAGDSTRILVQDDISNPLEPRNSFSNVIGSQVVFPHLRDGVVRYRPQGSVQMDVSTSTGNDTLYVGQPGSIIFSVNANGNQVQGLVWAYTLHFSGANWIGRMSDVLGGSQLDNVVPSASATATFASLAWNAHYGQGTNPDSLLYGMTSFGGPWTISDEAFRILVTPSGPGRVEFHAIVPPDILPPACCLSALDPGGSSLPIEFEQAKVITAAYSFVGLAIEGRCPERGDTYEGSGTAVHVSTTGNQGTLESLDLISITRGFFPTIPIQPPTLTGLDFMDVPRAPELIMYWVPQVGEAGTWKFCFQATNENGDTGIICDTIEVLSRTPDHFEWVPQHIQPKTGIPQATDLVSRITHNNDLQGIVMPFTLESASGGAFFDSPVLEPLQDMTGDVRPGADFLLGFASKTANTYTNDAISPDTVLGGMISFGAALQAPATRDAMILKSTIASVEGIIAVVQAEDPFFPPAGALTYNDPAGGTTFPTTSAGCFPVTFLRNVPPVVGCPLADYGVIGFGETITISGFTCDDPDGGPGPYAFAVASAQKDGAPAVPNFAPTFTGDTFSWQTSDADQSDVGVWTFCIECNDGTDNSSNQCCFTVDVVAAVPIPCFRIGCVPDAFSGSDVCVPLYIDNIDPCKELGGFDLLFTYDRSLLTFTGLDLAGSVLENSGWEYLTYRIVSTNPAKVRIVAIADMNNSNQHPSTFCIDGLIADLCFRTTNDRNLACQSAWLRFCWDDCGDNTASSRDGNDLFVVADPAHGPWAGGIIGQVEGGGIIHSSCGIETQLYEGLGGTTGPSELCCDSGHLVTDTLAPVFSPDFPLRIRGDANANKLPYEISDVVLFNNFLRDGFGALSPGPKADTQIVGMDVDGNWLAATAADLVLINQILVGRNSPVTDYVSGTAGVMQTSGTIDVSTSYADPTFEISAVTSHVVAGAMLKLTFPGTSILDVTGSGRTYASSVSHLTRSDTLFILLDNLTAFDTAIAIGSGPILEITTSGGGELTLFSVDAVTPQINGLASNLPPVQLGIPFVDTTFVKPCPTEGLYFVNGKIHIVCPGDIDDRGDLNLNSVAYEIADAVLYSNYFIEGPSVFQPGVAGEAQIAASDVNADGNPLLVADLVYLIRVITGDAQPIEGDLLGGGPKVAAGQLEVSLQPSGSTGKLNIASSHRLGAALVVIRTHGATINDVALGNLAESMDVAYRVKDGELRTLIYNIEDRAFVAPGAASLLEINTDRPGLLELVSVEAATFMGEALETNLANKVLPTEFALHPNYPNPFNPSTSMSIDFPRASKYNLTIYNVTGQVVRRFSGDALAGTLTLQWDGRDERGATVASGVYFSSLVAEGFEDTRKMLLLR